MEDSQFHQLRSSSSSSVASSQLNTNGHCFLCLREERSYYDGSSSSGMVISNPRGISSFTPLLCYLAGSSHEFHQNDEEDAAGSSGNASYSFDAEGYDGGIRKILRLIGHKLPPLCVNCYDNLAEMNGLHQDLIEIQRRLQERATNVRECVRKTTSTSNNNGDYHSCRDRFIKSLGDSEMPLEQISSVSSLVLRTHERIISKGTTPVIFPSSPSFNSGTSSMSTPLKKRKRSSTSPSSIPKLVVVDGTLDSSNKNQESADNQQYSDISSLSSVLLQNSDAPTPAAPLCQLARSTAAGVNVYCSMVEDHIANYDHDHMTSTTTGSETGTMSTLQVPPNTAKAQFKFPLPASSCVTLRAPTTTGTPQEPSPEQNKSSTKSLQKRGKTTSQYFQSFVTLHTSKGHSHSIPQHESRFQLCDVCNDRIPRGVDGVIHLACHIGTDYVSYCKDCEYSFISPFRLGKFHESRLFLPCSLDTTPIFQCDLCPTEADSMDTLRRHLGKHQTDLQITHEFNCPLCPLTFKSKKMVELHLGDNHVFLAKMSERQNCDICKSYFAFEEMESHLLTHGVKQPLRCKMCASMFSNLDSLIWHQSLAKQNWLHDKVCHLCENLTKFLSLASLRSHYFEAHGLGSKFICEICHDEFLTRDNWMEHQLKYHEGAEKKEECKSMVASSGDDSGVDTCAAARQQKSTTDI